VRAGIDPDPPVAHLDGVRGDLLAAPQAAIAPTALLPVRSFRLGPLGNGNLRAQLHVLSRHRVGSTLTVDLGEVSEASPSLDLPDLRQVLHQGRVRLPAGAPAERIAVCAHPVVETAEPGLFAHFRRQAPVIAFVGSDGTFTIDLPPGKYTLQLADLETGMVFHTEEADRTLGAEATTIEIAAPVHWLDVAFEPTVDDGHVVFCAIAFDVRRPRDGALPAKLGVPGPESNVRQEVLWLVPNGTRHARLLVPPGDLSMSATQPFPVLSPEHTDRIADTVAPALVDVKDPEHRLTLRIPPLPPDENILRGTR
jgi:hypothetical protein